MHDPIEAYIAELRARIGKSIPAEKREAVLAETESHLRESALEPRGETGAVLQFGPARRVAAALVSANGRKERVALGTVLLVIAPSLFWLAAMWWTTPPVRETSFWVRLCLMFGPFLIGGLGILQFKKLRPLRVAIALGLGLLLGGALVGALNVIPPTARAYTFAPRWQQAQLLVAARDNVVLLERLKSERGQQELRVGHYGVLTPYPGRYPTSMWIDRYLGWNRSLVSHIGTPEAAIGPSMRESVLYTLRDDGSWFGFALGLAFHLVCWLMRQLAAEFTMRIRRGRAHA